MLRPRYLFHAHAGLWLLLVVAILCGSFTDDAQLPYARQSLLEIARSLAVLARDLVLVIAEQLHVTPWLVAALPLLLFGIGLARRPRSARPGFALRVLLHLMLFVFGTYLVELALWSVTS